MKEAKKNVGIALQGGGAHGAFTWGVLDRLLEEENLVADAMCGTSAGAVNAVTCAYGLHIGGPAKAEFMSEHSKQDDPKNVFRKNGKYHPAWNVLIKFDNKGNYWLDT